MYMKLRDGGVGLEDNALKWALSCPVTLRERAAWTLEVCIANWRLRLPLKVSSV